MRFYDETIVITDPCYIETSHPLMRNSTIYGDWSCMVYPGKMEENKDYEVWDKAYAEFLDKTWSKDWKTTPEDIKNKIRKEFMEFREKWVEEKTLGQFCADAGAVGVFEMNRLSDKDRDWVREHPWCAAVVRDVDGDVNIVVRGKGNNRSCHVICEGKTPFFTIQSGL